MAIRGLPTTFVWFDCGEVSSSVSFTTTTGDVGSLIFAGLILMGESTRSLEAGENGLLLCRRGLLLEANGFLRVGTVQSLNVRDV